MLTGGGPEYATYTIMLYMYQTAFKSLDMGLAAAIANRHSVALRSIDVEELHALLKKYGGRY